MGAKVLEYVRVCVVIMVWNMVW